MKRIRSRIRFKIMISLLAVVLITGIASMVIGARIINSHLIKQSYIDVQADLNTARYLLNQTIIIKKRFLDYLSSLFDLQQALLKKDRSYLHHKLKEAIKEIDLDILNITDARGKVIVRLRDINNYGDNVSDDRFVKYVLQNRKSIYGTDLFQWESLVKEGSDLAYRSFIKILPTAHSIKETGLYEDRGMVVKVAAPILFNDRLLGVIYGAKLINKNNQLIDQIKNLIYKDEKLDGYDIGTATVFLGPVRIATNVKYKDGRRAIGTVVSDEVYSKVFEKEDLWIDKAFVVDTWYISAYGPIRDIEDKVIGILYVGILSEKYNRILRNTTIYFLLMIFITGIIAIIMAAYLNYNIIIPINKLVEASEGITRGDYERRIKIVSDDEMGYLCSTFNSMVDAIVEKDHKLMEQTESQIVQSEKLASLGRLASGIAHEINNPLTGVLTYSSLLKEDLQGTEYEEDLNVIVSETLRCRKIVKGILDFARDTKLDKQKLNINQIIRDTIEIIERHVNFQDIRIVKNLREDIPEVEVDIVQFKSVINNLAVNAADAMPDGGELIISTDYDDKEHFVIMTFRDTGIGISEENLSRIMDPFFTTKERGKGTGLGLAVTYGIVKRHNGFINIQSKVGAGTEFVIKIPVT